MSLQITQYHHISLVELCAGNSYRHSSGKDQQQHGGGHSMGWTPLGREGPWGQQQALPPHHGRTWDAAARQEPSEKSAGEASVGPHLMLGSCLGAPDLVMSQPRASPSTQPAPAPTAPPSLLEIASPCPPEPVV